MERSCLTIKNKIQALKGLVFDLDDTLYLQADYKRSGFRAVAQWLEDELKIDANQTYTQLVKIMEEKGPSYPFMFDDLLAQKQENLELVKKLTEIFINHTPQIHCFPGVISLLDKLRKYYLTGILTDGRQLSQEKKIKALDLQDKVDVILFSDSLGLTKPDKKLYEWFEDVFQLKGPELVYIGDNPQKDFIGANQRNWLTIRVNTGEYANLEAADQFKTKIELKNITELEPCLSSRFIEEK